MNKVDLHTAYEWVCDNCGVNNFCSSAHLDMSDEENQQAIREAFDLEDYEPIPDDLGGEWCTRPDKVKCSECLTEYEVNNGDE